MVDGAITGLSNVGSVTVVKSNEDAQGGFVWTATFVTPYGDLNAMPCDMAATMTARVRSWTDGEDERKRSATAFF